MPEWTWPVLGDELVSLQVRLAAAAADELATRSWTPSPNAVVAGCFVAFARGEQGPGRPGDRAWAAAVAWVGEPGSKEARSSDAMLRGVVQGSEPRQARDVRAQAVVAGRVPAAYAPGLLALREGPILAEALEALSVLPDVVMVDATGWDHPRRAGLAVHLGAYLDLPSVGVTHRPLSAEGTAPLFVRGGSSPLLLDGEIVARWVCTRTRARPVVAHAGWRTDPDSAADVTLATSTGKARTPVPLQEARRVAREARALANRDGVRPRS